MLENLLSFFPEIKQELQQILFSLPDFEQEKIKSEIESEIQKLLDFQNITLEDIQLLGKGQSFLAIGVGKAVLKLRHNLGLEYLIFENPYRLNPVYQRNLSNQIDLYVSERADLTNITEENVQSMYNLIRNNNRSLVRPTTK